MDKQIILEYFLSVRRIFLEVQYQQDALAQVGYAIQVTATDAILEGILRDNYDRAREYLKGQIKMKLSKEEKRRLKLLIQNVAHMR